MAQIDYRTRRCAVPLTEVRPGDPPAPPPTPTIIASPPTQLVKTFAFQSYLDDTLLQNAILAQAQGDAIVASTFAEAQSPGYAVGLSPLSQTPIAVQFLMADQKGASAAVLLKPGQFVRPVGSPNGVPKSFIGFRYGLPTGWLGGGTANLLVLQSPDGRVEWPSQAPELIFHRTRLSLIAPSAANQNPAPNFPLRFPWSQAKYGASATPIGGAPALVIQPTKILLRVRKTAIPAGGARVRLIFFNTDDFDLGSDGATLAGLSGGANSVDVQFPSHAQSGITMTGAAASNEYPSIFVDFPAARFGGDSCAVVAVDIDNVLGAGTKMDVVRYGIL